MRNTALLLILVVVVIVTSSHTQAQQPPAEIPTAQSGAAVTTAPALTEAQVVAEIKK